MVRVDGIERDYEAKVDILNDRVDAVSRAFEVRLAIENADYALKPGLFAELELRPEPREATLVERAALLGGEGTAYVFVLADGRAVRRPLRVRELDAARVEVLEGPGARRARAARPEPDAAHGRQPGRGRGDACGSLTSRSAAPSSR